MAGVQRKWFAVNEHAPFSDGAFVLENGRRAKQLAAAKDCRWPCSSRPSAPLDRALYLDRVSACETLTIGDEGRAGGRLQRR